MPRVLLSREGSPPLKSSSQSKSGQQATTEKRTVGQDITNQSLNQQRLQLKDLITSKPQRLPAYDDSSQSVISVSRVDDKLLAKISQDFR